MEKVDSETDNSGKSADSETDKNGKPAGTDNSGKPAETEAARPAVEQAPLAIGVGSVAFVVVMLLMLMAVLRAPPVDFAERRSSDANIPPEVYRQHILVDEYDAEAKTNALGMRELVIRGHVKNTGAMIVERADLRCHFPARRGGETSMDFPLVVDTRLDEVGAGPLGPFSARGFRVRLGEFPEELAPKILRTEIVNVRLNTH